MGGKTVPGIMATLEALMVALGHGKQACNMVGGVA